MFQCLRAGGGHYGGRGMRVAAMVIVNSLSLRECFVVFCVSIVQKLLPHGKTARQAVFAFCSIHIRSQGIFCLSPHF